MISLFLMACSPPETTDTNAEKFVQTDSPKIIYAGVSLDYSVGSISTLDLNSLQLTENIASVSGDPMVRIEDSTLYQLNRFQHDTLRRYELDNLSIPTKEISLREDGNSSSNPHDVAMCNGSLFLSQYDRASLLVLDPITLAEEDRIDLSSHADADGTPEASQMLVIGEMLYVGIQRLNRNNGWRSEGSELLKIDCDTRTVETIVSGLHDILTYPTSKNEEILLTSNATDDVQGRISIFNSETNQIEELIETGSDDITAAVINDTHLIYLSLSSDYSTHSITCMDLESKQTQIAYSGQEFLTDIVMASNQKAYIGAHWGWQNPAEASPGIYELDPTECVLSVPTPIMGELAPFSMAAVD